jgi:hypothetical protein
MNPQQILGVLSAATPILTTVLVGWGLNNEVAGMMAGGAVMIIAGGIALVINRPAAQAQSLVDHSDVRVEVGPNAPPGLQAMAIDPEVQNVVVAKGPISARRT